MRKLRGNGERMRKPFKPFMKKPFPHFLSISSPFPLSLSISSFSFHFLIIFPFPLHFLFLSPFPYSLSIFLQPGCQAATICATLRHCLSNMTTVSRVYKQQKQFKQVVVALQPLMPLLCCCYSKS